MAGDVVLLDGAATDRSTGEKSVAGIVFVAKAADGHNDAVGATHTAHVTAKSAKRVILVSRRASLQINGSPRRRRES